MKIRCNGLDLADAFAKVVKATPTKQVGMAIEGVKIKAFDNFLKLSATDGDFSIEKIIPADVFLEGEILVPSKLTAELLRKLNNEEVVLNNVDSENLKLEYLDSDTNLMTLNIDEYPKNEEYKFDVDIEIESKELKDLINKIIFAVATDLSRPALTGCLLEIRGNKIKGVALDGYRMAIAEKTLAKSYADCNIIVPSRAMSEISKLVEDTEEKVVMSISKRKLMLNLVHTKITTTLMDKDFLDYDKFLPKSFQSHISMSTDTLMNSLDRVLIIARANPANLIHLKTDDKILLISAKSEMGRIKENVPISREGKDFEISASGRFLSDCIKAIGTDYLTICCNTPNLPILVKPSDNDKTIYLIIPIRENI